MSRQNAPQKISITGRRRKREKEQRYQIILKAAERLFCEHGYPNTKIQDIAEAAEVAVGTVYFHFRNKEDLLLQLIDAIAFNVREILGKAFRGGETPVKRFENAGRAFFYDFCLVYPFQLVILLRESVGITPEVEAARRAILEQVFEDVVVAVQEMMREHNNDDRFVAEVVSSAICGMLERIAYQYLIWQDRSEELDTIVREAQAFIRGGISSILDNREGDKKRFS